MSDLIEIPAQGEDARLVARLRPPGAALPTLLYLHGFGSSQDGEKAEFFGDRAERQGFGFCSLDLQGHGRSGGSMRGLSLSRCLRDVDRARRAIEALRGAVAMVGSSMGGLVALWHAALGSPAQPVEALVLIAPALGLSETLRDSLGEEGLDRWRKDGTLEVTNELGTFELGWDFVADLEQYPADRLASLHRCPTLAFQGKLDDRVPWPAVAELARRTPGCTRLELIEDGDHRLVERLPWIWSEASNFLRAATSAPPSA